MILWVLMAVSIAVAAGVYLALSRDLFRVVVGLTLLGAAVNRLAAVLFAVSPWFNVVGSVTALGFYVASQTLKRVQSIADAFRTLVDQLLGEPAAHLAAWRAALQQGLGANAGLVTALVPELGMVIGETPPQSSMPASSSRSRCEGSDRFGGACTFMCGPSTVRAGATAARNSPTPGSGAERTAVPGLGRKVCTDTSGTCR